MQICQPVQNSHGHATVATLVIDELPAWAIAQIRSRAPKLKVLLVEDHRELAELLQLSLDREFDVRRVGNGREALEVLMHARPEHRPDVILLDFVMPLMNGWELCDALRAHPQLARIPVIAFTAVPERLGTHENIRAVLAKPVELETLCRTLRQFRTGEARPTVH